MGIQYRPIEIKFKQQVVEVVGLIDTGADNTIISETIAREIGIPLNSINDTIDAYTVTMENKVLKVVRVTLTEKWCNKRDTLEVGVTDDFFDPSEYGHGIHVIIGIDFLQDTDYEMSFTV